MPSRWCPARQELSLKSSVPPQQSLPSTPGISSSLFAALELAALAAVATAAAAAAAAELTGNPTFASTSNDEFPQQFPLFAFFWQHTVPVPQVATFQNCTRSPGDQPPSSSGQAGGVGEAAG
ncbi:hypothetical protein GTA08_BOTSDO11963 [Botryosphaeria dothidea]|uniref:Uncharacterized protein n=1 Tax=Botryosphaeria dothidea TaxID=55169 RepID=A0A8H4J4A7_9PEZI|nr:hypothetical protein GTA08_BOTSDO11963 [Botryosphaeria dothidea]